MADFYPTANFDWLGQLPGTARDVQDRIKTKASLADFTSGDADSLINKGASLLAINPEIGLKMIAEGRQRKAIEQRSEELKLYMETLKKNPPAAVPVAPTPQADPSRVIYDNSGGTAAAPAPPAPSPFTAPPASLNTVIPGPQTSLPPLSGAAAAALGPSPSDQMIAAAQAGGGPAPLPPPGPQLAGPPPTGGGPAPLAPQVPGPEMIRGAQAPAFTGAPSAPAPPRTSAQGLPSFQTDPAVAQEIQALQGELDKAVSNKFGRAHVQGIQMRLKAAIDKAGWSKDAKSFMIDQADRRAEGLPAQNYGVWEATKESQGRVIDSARKVYEDFEVKSDKAQDLSSKLELMDRITSNPNFAAGTAGKLIGHGAAELGGIWDVAVSFGLNPEAVTGIKKEQIPGMRGSQLSQVFQALASQTVVTALGTLGNQISNSDRDYINAAYPGLAGTKEGTQLLIQVMKEASKQAVVAGNAARMYIRENRGKEDAADLREAVDKIRNSRSFIHKSDGSLTDLGQKIEDLGKAAPVPGAGGLIERLTGGGSGASSTPAKPPVTSAPTGTIVYDKDGNPHRLTPNGPVPVAPGGI